MTLLVISPDYASHLLPLATLATAWRDAGERVVVATGPATEAIISSFGFDRVELTLGRGSNPGVARADRQVPEEDESLRGFFAATRGGMLPTLRYQADQRATDLLWRPVEKAEATLRVLDAVQPDHILVDHLAYSARLALASRDVDHADVVLGHPSALPVGAEVYGYPTSWPKAFSPSPSGLGILHARCRAVSSAFTAEWNAALAILEPARSPVENAFAEHGSTVLLNYPAALHDPTRTDLLPAGHTFLGSSVRTESPPPDVRRWLDEADDRPVVCVTFGSFLSARGDVLERVAAALSGLDVRVALAVGSADTSRWADLPEDWLVRESLPQVAVLAHAALLVTHGGNNSITEALTFGVPMLVLPFSTDQFAGAQGVEAAGLGASLDPNAATTGELAAALTTLLGTGPTPAGRSLADQLTRTPGPALAYATVAGAALGSQS